MIVKYIVLGFLAISAVGVGATYLNAASNVATAPARVISKTAETDNIIYNYEWFYDVNAQYNARTAQLQAWSQEFNKEEDASERRKLRVEVQAVSQSCRNLVTSYNANSQKMNRSIFKGWSLPVDLDIINCEVSK